MSRYVDEYRGRFGVEPICRTLGVSASAYYERASGRRSERAVEDERLLERIRGLHASNYYAYGYRRMWKTLLRAGERVPRCRVQRLMRVSGIQGAKRRGKPWRTTRPDAQAQRRPDLVQRDFSASRPHDRRLVARDAYADRAGDRRARDGERAAPARRRPDRAHRSRLPGRIQSVVATLEREELR